MTEEDENQNQICRGMIVRPVVFFSDWLGVVLSEPRQYEPTEEENDMLIYAPQQNLNPFYWDGVEVVDVYWFTEGQRNEEFVDFLEIVSPPQDDLDDPDYFRKKCNYHWTRDDE